VNSRVVASVGDDLPLAFANTRYWRGSDEPTETLQDIERALAWCAEVNLLNSATAARLKKWAERNRQPAMRLFNEIVSIREAIYCIFASVVTGSVDPRHIAQLNERLGRAPRRTEIVKLKPRWVWQLPAAEPTFENLFAPVLWSAGDLLVGPRLSGVRLCANPKCRWLFLDDSKNGTRRWCSMSSCGNRAKAHRHYVKTTSKAADEKT
jgi:predicted RNA-binding Zn ribbon-like protein